MVDLPAEQRSRTPAPTGSEVGSGRRFLQIDPAAGAGLPLIPAPIRLDALVGIQDAGDLAGPHTGGEDPALPVVYCLSR